MYTVSVHHKQTTCIQCLHSIDSCTHIQCTPYKGILRCVQYSHNDGSAFARTWITLQLSFDRTAPRNAPFQVYCNVWGIQQRRWVRAAWGYSNEDGLGPQKGVGKYASIRRIHHTHTLSLSHTHACTHTQAVLSSHHHRRILSTPCQYMAVYRQPSLIHRQIWKGLNVIVRAHTPRKRHVHACTHMERTRCERAMSAIHR